MTKTSLRISASALAFAVALAGIAHAQPAPATPPRTPPYNGYYDAALADMAAKARQESDQAGARCDLTAMEAIQTKLNGEILDEKTAVGANAANMTTFAPEAYREQQLDLAKLDALNAALKRDLVTRRNACSENADPDEEYAGGDAEDDELALAAGSAEARLARLAFLGREGLGALAPTLDLFPSDRKLSGETYSAEMNIDLDGENAFDAGGLWLRGTHTTVDSQARWDRLELGTDRLVIPGLGVGADGNGFALDSFGGLNTPRDILVHRDAERTAIEGGLTRPLVDGGGTSIDLKVGIGYGAGDDRSLFEASIPGYLRDVSYLQTINTDRVYVVIEFGAEHRIAPQFVIGGQVITNVGQIWSEGSNRLDFTGFAPQEVKDDVSETAFAATFRAYFTYHLTRQLSLALIASANFSSGEPVWLTPGGGDLAEIVFDDALFYDLLFRVGTVF